MKDGFRIRLCSDVNFEEMVADICYEDNTIGTITQENGVDKMEIEIFPPVEGTGSWNFILDDFLEAINSAKECLRKMEKLPKE